jgi:NAD(P)-dependent dehydrogenase (short-subunit alcohol dehydrogenase family)
MPKTIIITGASGGIGAAAAARLANKGQDVVVVGRSKEKTIAVARELKSDYAIADFARLDDVRALAETLQGRYARIDVLANNAGGMFGDPQKTVDGFEKTLQVNHLAPFLLTSLLLPTLLRSDAAVIQTSSDAARISGRIDIDDLNSDVKLSPVKAYGDAKLANILFTTELHKRFGDQGLSSAAFHPGTVATNFASDSASAVARFVYKNPLIRRLIYTPDRGAEQLVWLATGAPNNDWDSGKYYEKGRLARKSNPQASDPDLAERLWDLSAAMVGLPVR